MNTAIRFTLGLLLANSQAWAHSDHLVPQFGGVTAEAGSFQVELVSKGNRITLYLTEHGAPLEAAGSTGKLSVQTGKSREEVGLTPLGYQTLGAKLNAKPARGAQVEASITPRGRETATVRFKLK
jgi:hypothetical protein